MEASNAKESPKCAGCLNNIGDEDCVSALQQDWHKDCFRCSVCDALLSSWYFEENGLLFCQPDYWAKYGECCQQCSQVITGPVMAAGSHRFHPECFACAQCGAPIEDSEPYALVERTRLYCGGCYSSSGGAHCIRVVALPSSALRAEPSPRDPATLTVTHFESSCGVVRLHIGDRILEINGAPPRAAALDVRPPALLQLTIEHNPETTTQNRAMCNIIPDKEPQELSNVRNNNENTRNIEKSQEEEKDRDIEREKEGKRERLFKRKGEDGGRNRVIKRRQTPSSPLLGEKERSSSMSKLLDVSECAEEGRGVLCELSRARSFRAEPAPPQKVFRAADLIQGELLGSGFFGEVYKVTHRATNEVMVLKQLYRVDDEAQRNFLKEVAVLRSLSHPNVLRFVGVVYKDKRLHLVTEYVAGGTLHHLIQDSSVPLSWVSRARLARDVAAGVGYLHRRNVIHRDLNSHNCLVREDKTVIVADFGLARIVQRTESSTVQRGSPHNHTLRKKRYTVVGNPYWMAPEMMNGKVYDEKVDVFSFGVILCEIIGRVSADPDFLPRRSDFGLNEALFVEKFCRHAACPEPFYRVAFRACQLDPDDRPPFEVIEIWLESLVMQLGRRGPSPSALLADILQYAHAHTPHHPRPAAPHCHTLHAGSDKQERIPCQRDGMNKSCCKQEKCCHCATTYTQQQQCCAHAYTQRQNQCDSECVVCQKERHSCDNGCVLGQQGRHTCDTGCVVCQQERNSCDTGCVLGQQGRHTCDTGCVVCQQERNSCDTGCVLGQQGRHTCDTGCVVCQQERNSCDTGCVLGQQERHSCDSGCVLGQQERHSCDSGCLLERHCVCRVRRMPSNAGSEDLVPDVGVIKCDSNATLDFTMGRWECGRALGKCVSASHIGQRSHAPVTSLSRSQNTLASPGYILRAVGNTLNITKVDDITEWLDSPPPLKRTSPDAHLNKLQENKTRKVDDTDLPPFLRNQSVEGLESQCHLLDSSAPLARHVSIPDDTDSSDEEYDYDRYKSVTNSRKMDVDPKSVSSLAEKEGLPPKKASYDVADVTLRNPECVDERKIPDEDRRRFNIDHLIKSPIMAEGIKHIPKTIEKDKEKTNFFSKKLLSPRLSRLFKPNTTEVDGSKADDDLKEKSRSKFFVRRPASPNGDGRSYRVRPVGDIDKKRIGNEVENEVLKSDIKLASMGKPMTPTFRRHLPNERPDFVDGRFSYRVTRPKLEPKREPKFIEIGRNRIKAPLPIEKKIRNAQNNPQITLNAPKSPEEKPKRREGISRSNYVSLANLKINSKKDLDQTDDRSPVERVI